MQCLNCGGQLEWAGGGQHARCMNCLSLFNQQNGQLTPIVVQAPGGGNNPEFNAMFAQNLGFGPPPPGAGGGAGMQPMQQQQQPQHNLSAGTFDMGGGAQLRVKINGKTPENYLKDRASSMIWGWIIGAVIIGLIIIGGIGLGIYIYFQAKDGGGGNPSAARAVAAAKWDGKSELTCGGNDVIAVSGVTATAGITAGGSCTVTLANVNITAPVPINAGANARVTISGGSLNGSTNSIVALGSSQVTVVGCKVTGKVKSLGAAKVTGVP